MGAIENEASASSIAGQVAVITGGGRGLGRVIALDLAAAGAAVAVLGRSEAHLAARVAAIQEAGGQALAVPTEVTDRQAVERSVATVEHELGRVSLLVNNAAIVTPLGPLWETDPDEWWRTLDVNLRGPLLGMQAVAPRMIRRRQGRIVNVASGAALEAIPYGSAYVVSKTALVRLSENAALELKEHGVSVFAVDPGTVRTDMSGYLLESPAGQRWLPWYRGIFDQGLNVTADRIAHLVRRIASGHVDALSGCFLSVSDDSDVLLAQAATGTHTDLHTLRLRT
jgi:NAD(P)-dependent dehydrogenase (short-subunit alcohol dehydrogenase family)